MTIHDHGASDVPGAPDPAGDATGYVPVPDRWRIHSVLLVTVAMTLTGINILNVALPSLQSSLHATESDVQWVLASYALTFGVTLIPAGRAGDVLGRGAMFLVGAVLFLGASILAGLAGDVATLIVARCVQGVGSGILAPQVIGIIQQNFRGAERGRAFGVYGSVVAVAMGAAPLLGGVIMQLAGAHDGWRWTFLVNVPVSITAIVLALAWFHRPLLTRRMGHRLDLDPVGVVLLGASVLLVLIPFVSASETGYVWLLLPLSGVTATAWVFWERHYRRRGREPVVEMSMLSNAGFSNGVVLATTYFFGITAVWVLVALFLMQGLGFTAFEAGLVGLPSAACGTIAARWAGRRVTRWGRRIVTIGIAVAAGGLLVSIGIIHLHALGHANIWWLLLTLAPMGIGQGFVISPNQTLTLMEVPLDYAGSTGGILQTGQRIGSATGIAVMTAIAFGVLGFADWTASISVSFLVIAGALLVTLVLSVLDERGRGRRARRPADG